MGSTAAREKTRKKLWEEGVPRAYLGVVLLVASRYGECGSVRREDLFAGRRAEGDWRRAERRLWHRRPRWRPPHARTRSHADACTSTRRCTYTLRDEYTCTR